MESHYRDWRMLIMIIEVNGRDRGARHFARYQDHPQKYLHSDIHHPHQFHNAQWTDLLCRPMRRFHLPGT